MFPSPRLPSPFRLQWSTPFYFLFAGSIFLVACSCSRSQSSASSETIGGPPPPPSDANSAPSPSPDASLQTLPPLDQLLAPIALYPDPLIALLLPASAFPSDLQAAGSFLAANNDPSQIDGQSWDASVKGLAHYPEVVQWMNSNPAWTQQVGQAFASAPADVMNAIQDLRARAKAAGTLTDSPQEAIVTDGDDIDIEPAQPDVIYVPRYDPDAVYFGYAGGYGGGPYFTYGDPYPMGIWLGFDFDWHNHALWAGNWYQWRRANGGWRQPFNPSRANFAASVNAHAWHVPAAAVRAAPMPNPGTRQTFARPQPMPGTPQPRRLPAPDARTEQRPPVRPTPDVRAEPRPPVRPAPDVRLEPRAPVGPAPDVRVEERPPVRPTPAPELRPQERQGIPGPQTPAPEERRIERAPEQGRPPERVQETAPPREGERPAPANRETPSRKDPPRDPPPDDQKKEG